MARANLTTRLSLDTSKFDMGLRRAGAMVRAFGTGMLKIGGLVTQAAKSMKLLGVAGLGAGAGLAFGVKKALDFGGRMSDVREQTGLSVTNIQIWEEAMRAGGIQGESFGKIVAKMQKTIGEFALGTATGKDAFEIMKISLEDIINLDPDKQLTAIQKALMGVENRALRVNAATKVFGREGAKLFTVFGADGALNQARTSLGAQVAIFERQADIFDRISDIIGGIGVKLRGFFAGVADTLAPMLLKVAEAWDKVDLSGLGRQLGHWMGELIKNWKRLPEILWEGLKVVIAKLIALMVEGFKMAGSFLLNAITHIAQFIGDTIKDAIMPGKQNVKSLADRFKETGGSLFTFTLDADAASKKFKALLGEVFTKVGPAPANMPAAGGQEQAQRVHGRVRTSRLDYLVKARQESEAFKAGIFVGGFNVATDKSRNKDAQGNLVVGGKDFISDQFAAKPLKMFADKLDIFAKAPSADVRAQVAKLVKKTEPEKQTALLAKQKESQEKATEALQMIAQWVPGLSWAIQDTLGPLK